MHSGHLVFSCREKRRRRSNSFGGSSSGGDSFNGEPRGVVGGHTSNMSNGGVQTKKTSSMLRFESTLFVIAKLNITCFELHYFRSRNGECSSTETVDTQVSNFLWNMKRSSFKVMLTWWITFFAVKNIFCLYDMTIRKDLRIRFTIPDGI